MKICLYVCMIYKHTCKTWVFECATMRVSILHHLRARFLAFFSFCLHCSLSVHCAFYFLTYCIVLSHVLPLFAAAKQNVCLFFLLFLCDYLLRKYLLYRWIDFGCLLHCKYDHPGTASKVSFIGNLFCFVFIVYKYMYVYVRK